MMRVIVALSVAMLVGTIRADDSAGYFLTRWSANQRVRVNSPDTLAGPHKDREESKATGKLTIDIPEPVESLRGAELYLELWGGHPGTATKAVMLNGRGIYALPEHGAAEMNCVYSYPLVSLKLADLVEGKNELQFSCEKGKSFWGHYIIDNAAMRLAVPPEHARVEAMGLTGMRPPTVLAHQADERIDLSLDTPESMRPMIAAVDYQGFYDGYDENGDGAWRDWHGFTKSRRPQAIIGTATNPPYRVTWHLSMLPDQKDMKVRAIVRFKGESGLGYQTPAVEGLSTGPRAAAVRLHRAADLPRPFWSRASKRMACSIDLDEEPATIERAELHAAIWDGGRGNVAEPFTLNGVALPVTGAGKHDLLYRVVPVEPHVLRKGPNQIVVFSDTEHHGIEVLLPGPALIVRSRR